MGGYLNENTKRERYNTFKQNNPGRNVSYETYAKKTNEKFNQFFGDIRNRQQIAADTDNNDPKSDENKLYSLVDESVEDDASLGGSVRKAQGSIGGDDEAYSERMKGRFKKGLQSRG